MDPQPQDFADSTPEVQESQLRRMGQRWRTILRVAFLSLALVLWIAFLEGTAHEHRLALSAVSDRDANLATAVEHYVVRVLRTARAVHQYLRGLLLQRRGDAEVAEALADRLRANDAFAVLGLCLADGRVLVAPAGSPYLTPDICAGIFPKVLVRPEITVLPPLGPAGALQIPLALPLDDPSGQRLAVAVAFTPVETMLGIMQSVVLQEDTEVVLAGPDDRPRAAWRSRGSHVRDPAGFGVFGELLRSANGKARIGGREYLVSSRDMDVAGLRVQVASASDDALATFRTRRGHMLLLCALVSLGLFAAYRLLAGMHAESLERARALSRARGQLQALNARLDSQVQERTAQLEQAYRDLETFSYAVAHDVRAPLASISGFAEALEPPLRRAGDDKALHYLRRIRANAQQMDELTRHLLELGRLTRAPLATGRVDLSALAEEVVAGLRDGDPQRQVEVTVQPELWANGDRTLLRQVLENLLGNAWKFTSRRDTAHIGVTRGPAEGDKQVVVMVSDDGEGFDSEQAPDLFQPFRRMHTKEEFPGTGVGLAAVQRIVALHGGRVWCESRRGAGARFFFSLPA